MQRRYITVDVFTERAFGGNPLAVVLDAGGLRRRRCRPSRPNSTMPRRPSCCRRARPRTDAQVRIFTVTEMPFAGHPNVGTAFVLATRRPSRRRGFGSRKARVWCRSKSSPRGKVVGAELTAPQPLKKSSQFSVEQAAA